jgi:hypothetical protein
MAEILGDHKGDILKLGLLQNRIDNGNTQNKFLGVFVLHGCSDPQIFETF